MNYIKFSTPLSNSNLSLDSIEEDETEPWHGLFHKLSAFHLDSLNARFKEKEYSNDEKVKEYGLKKEEFVNAIDELFGNCKNSLQATILFDKIDKEDNHKITWNQFLDFVIENSNFSFDDRLHLKVLEIFSPPHVKRETIIKIVPIETEKYFCYAILSKYGRIGIYDGNVNFLTSYHLIMTREDINRKDEERRRRNRWVTDAIFLEDALYFIVTTTARNITIYDASNLKHIILWLILGVPNVIECFTYYPKDINTKILFMGDDKGQILSLTFVQPKNEFFRKKHNDKLSIFYWIELENEKDYVVIKNYGKLFQESVKKIKILFHNSTIVASSRDPNASVLIRHYENRLNPYTFKIRRGASCFDLSSILKILITGSDDGNVRIWNVVGTEKPSSTLKGHKTGVIDVKIIESLQVFLSCSRDGILKLWLLKEEVCVQTLNVKFPSFQILGKTIEWGFESIYAGPKRISSYESSKWERSHIFVACCNYVAKISLRLNENEDLENSVLPPPPLQNSVLIPTNWRINEDSEELNEPTRELPDEEVLQNHLSSLEFILNKKFFTEGDMATKINYQIANIEFQKRKMKPLISKCAPYLTLDLHEFKNIELSSNLPPPNSKKIKNLLEKIQKKLSDASSRDQIFSEPLSSSRSRSSRSSLLSFD